jgi:hypothetical protein
MEVISDFRVAETSIRAGRSRVQHTQFVSNRANATLEAGGTSDGEFRGSLELLLPLHSKARDLLFAYPAWRREMTDNEAQSNRIKPVWVFFGIPR